MFYSSFFVLALFSVQTFIAGQTRSVAPHTPRIILLGATGSGKATQAAILGSKYNVVNSKYLLFKLTLSNTQVCYLKIALYGNVDYWFIYTFQSQLFFTEFHNSFMTFSDNHVSILIIPCQGLIITVVPC